MEKVIDNMLDSIFGGVNLWLNIIVGAILIGVGIVCLASAKKQTSKIKRITGWICIGIGCLGVLSGVIQSLL